MTNIRQKVKAITFDAGGTLIEAWPSVGHVYAAVAAEHGYPNLPADQLTLRFLSAWNTQRDFDYSRPAWKRLVEVTFDGLVECPLSERFFSALYQRFDHPDAWQVFPDVYPVLETLRRAKVKLGIISNWDDRLRGLLFRLGLGSYFEAMVISIEVGLTKPAREIFERAAALMDVEPASILHIGDSRHEDFAGAQAAGFRAILLDRNADSPGENSIGTLREVVSRL